jgi:hypothetical protein
MNQGFEQAKSQRNWLERLGAKIPGFGGFLDRELRRDVDKSQREHLAAEVGRIKETLRGKARGYSDSGAIAALAVVERLEKKLDGLSQAIRFADYGASGLFDVEKIDADQLDRLYEFDVQWVEALAQLRGEIEGLPAGSDNPGTALESALAHLEALASHWATRGQVISSVVQAK